jgi:hypothetical protein
MGTSLVRRSRLVIVGVTMVFAVGLGLAFMGVSYVNIDSLRAHPLPFILLFVAAPALATLSLLLAAVPRVPQINILVFVGLWACLELAFGLIRSRVPEPHGDPVSINHKYYSRDPWLGYRATPNTIARHIKLIGTKQMFNVTYLIDRFGRRETPVSNQRSRKRFLLFFGGSNTFGDGLEQTETLPSWAGQLAPGYYPYNYGFSGWGPAQMLDVLKSRDLKPEVRQTEGYAIFFFISAHIGRVVGSSLVSTGWGRDFSLYTMAADGELMRQGSFAAARPFTTLGYELLNSSNAVRFFQVALPWRYSDQDYRLTAQIMNQSQAILEKEFRLQGFYVVISPAFDQREIQISRRFMKALREVGVKYLDFTDLYDTKDLRYREAKADRHNSSLADRLIAAEIVKTLRIGKEPQAHGAASVTPGQVK